MPYNMYMAKTNYQTIDDYIKAAPAAVQPILEKIRRTVHKAVPEADETISYQLAAFKLRGKAVVYFGAWQKHIGFYATPAGNRAFQEQLAPYKQAKGSVQFPLDKPMPYDLIAQIAAYRSQEILGQ